MFRVPKLDAASAIDLQQETLDEGVIGREIDLRPFGNGGKRHAVGAIKRADKAARGVQRRQSTARGDGSSDPPRS